MDRINADLLRTFVEVAKVEHLSRAAEALQADQSTVSRKVARLEQEVGVLLFERIGRNIRLTQAGRRLVGRAERILDDLRDAIAEAEGAVAAESGRVEMPLVCLSRSVACGSTELKACSSRKWDRWERKKRPASWPSIARVARSSSSGEDA